MNDTLSTRSSNSAGRIQQLEQRLREQEKSLGKRFDELASLTRMLEEERAQKAVLQQELDDLRQQQASAAPAVSAHDDEPLVIELTEAERRRNLAHRELVSQSELFDGDWYLASYPDVREHEQFSQAPHDHYLLFGGFEGRKPCPEFDSDYYLKCYSDVAEAKVSPLVHYLLYGRDEGRRTSPASERPV